MTRPFLTLGAAVVPGGTRFVVYAPDARTAELVLDPERGADAAPLPGPEPAPPPGARIVALADAGDGLREAFVPGAGAGTRYRYRLDGGPLFPDPASRRQPLGVHGPSEVVDPAGYEWRDAGWAGLTLPQMVLYELHVGTFTPDGTFAAAAAKLPWLRELGINTVELMPLHAFPGARNWGYDGAALFAPPAAYGTPDELRALVDDAHALGMAVLVDVVYNHVGPDGAYVAAFDRSLLKREGGTPWGSSMNMDGTRARAVRELFVQNALLWLREYHADGLRLDATAYLHDTSDPHFLAELGERLRTAAGTRPFTLVAEDDRNLNTLLAPRDQGGLGIDGVWNFYLHHQFHRVLTGERDVYYAGFRDSVRDLARALRSGWIYTGQRDPYHDAPRGTDPAGIAPWRFVSYLQNHDEVGNRPLGDRLPAICGLPAYRAAMALLLASPHTPLLFMGDEWAATAPFHFFTDHKPTIGAKVAAGRRAYFARWTGWRSPDKLAALRDPQDEATFDASRLDWSEPAREPHASALRWVKRLLALRRDEPALAPGTVAFDVTAIARRAVLLVRRAPKAPAIAVIAAFEAGRVEVTPPGRGAAWQVLMTSEDLEHAPDADPPVIADGGTAIEFHRPGAAVLRQR